jgi:hypothetical protein
VLETVVERPIRLNSSEDETVYRRSEALSIANRAKARRASGIRVVFAPFLGRQRRVVADRRGLLTVFDDVKHTLLSQRVFGVTPPGTGGVTLYAAARRQRAS